ncbi:MAG TPA: sugar transferase, partial [Verrucomicrobiae bacterium]|nr:sugar transferase [Verrucomicrobiae bacterium]
DRQIRTQLNQFIDAIIFGLSFWLAFAARLDPTVNAWLAQLLGTENISAESLEKVNWLYFVIGLSAPLVLESQQFYNRPALASRWAYLWPLIKGCFMITVGLVVLTYLFHIILPRGVAVVFGVISFALVAGKEEITNVALRSKLAQAQLKRRFILVGTELEIARLRREMRKNDSVEAVGELNLASTPIEKIVSLLHEHSVYGVILTAKHTNFEQAEYVIRACELEGVEVWLMADFFHTQLSRTTLDDFHGRPLMVFRTTPETSWQGAMKQVIDLLGGLTLLLLVGWWLFPLIAILIKISSPGPVFFKQQRSGQNGAPFTLYKFRTMVTNAEQFKHELAAMNEMTGPVFKVTNDPRVTRIGKWLRKYSLDEFPQVFNVLRGEMSLVGPRPLPVDEVKRFENLAHRRRLSVKPGLTCLWQISGRNQISDFKEWVRLDLEYIDNWSIWLDLKILFRTIPAVFAGTGAK